MSMPSRAPVIPKRSNACTRSTRPENSRLFLCRGFPYKLFGLIPTDRHLLGVGQGYRSGPCLSWVRTCRDGIYGRDCSMPRISVSIGLVGVALGLFLGVLLGGVSGFYGGWVDTLIQRIIEIFRSIPTVPLWMGLAAALPRDWSILQIYFAITIIISLLGWTELAWYVAGFRLREEDFVVAARLAGCKDAHHLRAHGALIHESHHRCHYPGAAIVIISETSLSFLGLGLRHAGSELGRAAATGPECANGSDLPGS